jgi:hypothetical protein
MVLAAATAGLVLAAGCAPADPPARPARATATRSAAAGAATLAGNRALARREAGRLLALVPLPAGAAVIALPRSTDPVLPVSAGDPVADATRSWLVPMTYPAAAAWLQRHRPAGMPPADSMSGQPIPQHDPFTGYGYAGPASPAWASAELDLEMAQNGTQAVMWADGQVTWLDPVPVRDTATGPRLRLTVAGPCPRRDRGDVGVTSPDAAGLTTALLPAGPPSAGLECRYAGANGPGPDFGLRAATRLNATQAGRVARSMARRPVSHVDGLVVPCPMDDGTAEVIALSYPGRPDVDLWVTLTGCTFVANGHIAGGGFYVQPAQERPAASPA